MYFDNSRTIEGKSRPALYLADAGEARATGVWYRDFEYERERERGLDYREDLFNPCVLDADFGRGRVRAVIASTEPNELASADALRAIGRAPLFWLRQATMRRAIDATRQRRRRQQVALEDVPELEAGALQRDPMLGEVLRRLIAALPEAARMVVVLRYQEDLDPAEIAELIKMPLATVKSHLHRSLAMLRQKLACRGVGEP